MSSIYVFLCPRKATRKEINAAAAAMRMNPVDVAKGPHLSRSVTPEEIQRAIAAAGAQKKGGRDGRDDSKNLE